MADRNTTEYVVGSGHRGWPGRASALMLLVLLLAACGSPNTATSPQAGATPSPTTEATAQPTTAETMMAGTTATETAMAETTTAETSTAEAATATMAAETSTSMATAVAIGPGVGPRVKVTDITRNADTYVGQPVSVVGKVAKPLTAGAFLLDEDPEAGQGVNNELLVIEAKKETGGGATEGAKLEVMGIVRRFDRAALEKELGYNLEQTVFSAYPGGRPVIVATVVRPAP